MDAVPDPTTMLNEASAVRVAGGTSRALDMYRALVGAHPNFFLGWQHLGGLLRELGRAEDAETPLRQAHRLAPGDIRTRHVLATTLMALGKYPEAWSFYDARFSLPGSTDERPRNFPFPQWRSWHVGGKHILIFPEQGQGDQIQSARFVPQLIAQGARITMLARPSLVRLFADSFPDARVLATSGAVNFPDPDFWVMSSDLPGLAGATPASLPGQPYLRTSAIWPSSPAGFKIGLMTKGNPAYSRDAARSLTPVLADRLAAELPGRIVELDPETSGATDFADTAAIIDQLDLVVSVDTSVAHLAGAMGKKCLMLIPGFGTDWRWMTGRDDSPWYPNHRLYRGAVDGDWTDAIDRLTADARTLAGVTS